MRLEAAFSPELDQILIEKQPELTADVRKAILHFYELLLQGNEVQNLTRLTSPSDFYHGNIIDVLELLKGDWLEFPVMDLGSGSGIPGLLAAVIRGKGLNPAGKLPESREKWLLVDSERRKAEFLKDSVEKLGLSETIQVVPGRAEDCLKAKENKVGVIIARAVGPVERIYGWLRGCSTWNKLVLFKGPNWDKEWADFQASKFKGELEVARKQLYHVGPEAKERCLVELKRVPRGTKK